MAAADEINLQALPYNIQGYKQQLVDLPSGTLLFRANHIKSDNDGRDFFWDLLGIPTADGFCMSPVHNVFTFPFPYVGFGLNVWGNEFRAAWAKYNCIQVYVLKCSAPFINLISPSKESRGITKQRDNYKNQPIRRCDTFGAACATNPAEKKAHLKYLTYDNCIVPAFREQTGCIGHIAIGANDSIDVQDASVKPHDSPMGQYLRLLSQTNPMDAATIASKLYVDTNGHRGIPEIVVTPLKPGLTPQLKQTATTFKDAAQKVIQGTQDDIYTLELITAITKDGYDTSLPDAASTETPNNQRLSIEQHLYSFMEKGQTEGFGQAGKIMFDSRTGFYVLTGFLQDGYRLGNRGATVDYMCDFLRPLDTPKLRQSAIEYSASIRRPVPKESFLSESKEARGYKKAFIFKRPGSLKKIMTELALKIPTMADGRPFTYLYKYDTMTGGVRCTMKKRSKCRKTKRRQRNQQGAGIFDFLKSNTVTAQQSSIQEYSIPLEQESIPAPIMDNIRDFFAQMRG